MGNANAGRRRLILAALLTLGVCEGTAAQAASTPVTACGQVLDAPGDYHLTGNLGPCVEHGVEISANNVRLDLAGFTVSGDCGPDFEAGIAAIDHRVRNVQVEGGTLTGFCFGIFLPGSNNRIRGLTVIGRGDRSLAGVLMFADGVVETSVVTGFQGGVYVTSEASRATVRANHVYGNGEGILVASSGSRIRDNIIHDQLGAGISIAGEQDVARDTVVRGNVVMRNGDGVLLSGESASSRVRNNTVNGNVRAGIAIVAGSDANLVAGNQARGNGTFDLLDQNAGCGANQWRANRFGADSVAGQPDGGPGAGCIR